MSADESFFKKPEGVKVGISAGGVIVRKSEGNTLIGLTRGSSDYHDYTLPKGHAEGAETLEQTAKREIFEEVGIKDLKLITGLGKTERLSFHKDEWKITTYFLFETNQVESIESGDKGFNEIEWFEINDLPEIFWPEQKEMIVKAITALRSI